jgi:PAS domain S-box-containing protein
METTQDIFDILLKDENYRIIMKRLLETSIKESFNAIMITEAGPGYPIVFANQAFTTLTGYELGDVMGQSPSILQGPNTDQAVLNQLKEKLGAGELFYGKAINYRKDGSTFMMEWKIAPIRNHDDTITHYLAIQREAI